MGLCFEHNKLRVGDKTIDICERCGGEVVNLSDTKYRFCHECSKKEDICVVCGKEVLPFYKSGKEEDSKDISISIGYKGLPAEYTRMPRSQLKALKETLEEEIEKINRLLSMPSRGG